ncbi:MAG TPA: hypothetical protein VN034_00990 [Sphingopyxis sp.]|nr:hypothetical protein [Sphingopyxis sp.]
MSLSIMPMTPGAGASRYNVGKGLRSSLDFIKGAPSLPTLPGKSTALSCREPGTEGFEMNDVPGLGVMNLIEAQEASDVSAINGILSLANILRKRGLLSDAEASAMYESMSLPLGLPKYAENPDVQDIQSNLDRLFAVVMQPK